MSGCELKSISVSREFVEFALFNDLLTERCRVFCKGYEGDDDNFVEIFKFDCLEDDGSIELADNWHTFELWLY